VKVAIDISPLNDSGSVRGIGTYTNYLVNDLKKISGKIQITTFSGKDIPESDLIHYPYFDLYFHTLPFRKTRPRVVTIHDVIPLVFKKHYPAGLKGRYNLFLQKLALKNTDAVICDSNTSKQDIHKILGYPFNKIYVIYLAPAPVFKPMQNSNYLENIRNKYKLPQEYFLFVGDVNWNKNIIGLLSAVKKTRVNLVLVGKALLNQNLPQVRDINSEIEKLKIKNKIIKTGYIPDKDLSAIYNLATATIVPSFYEGFGLPVLESMACGTPVLCSNNSSLSEIGHDTALFFDPHKKDDIKNAITKFLSKSQKDREKISKDSQNLAAKYTWNNVTRQTTEVYDSVICK